MYKYIIEYIFKYILYYVRVCVISQIELFWNTLFILVFIKCLQFFYIRIYNNKKEFIFKITIQI